MMSTRNFIATAFMAFAFFFGAGNLIFPPFSGLQAGTTFGWAYVGFILVDVGLSFIAIVAVAIAGRAAFLTVDFPRWWSVIFWVAIYTIIGPAFATPRTAVVSYDMGLLPFIHTSSHVPLFLFSLCFFVFSCWLVLYPGRLVNFIGEYMTPALLACLAAIFAVMIFSSPSEIAPPTGAYTENPFGQGLVQGYLTMDTLGALAFGAIISSAVRGFNLPSEKHVLRTTIHVSILAGILLAIVYFGLFYMGATSKNIASYATNGGEVLTMFVNKYFGTSGQVILSIIILLACLTTAVGLITSCAEYFHSLYRKIPYRIWAITLSFISFAVANLGLNLIISLSTPVVIALYPLTIVVIFAAILRKFITISHKAIIITSTVAFVFSLTDAINSVNHAFDKSWIQKLPLFSNGLGWLFPTLIVFIIGVLVSLLYRKQPQQKEIKSESI